jgi:hypothetical protein
VAPLTRRRDPVRASDEELEDLQPIIQALLRQLEPDTAKMHARGHFAGAKTRILSLQDIDVDVVALARFVRDWTPVRRGPPE